MKNHESVAHRFASHSMSLVALIAIAIGGANVALAQTQQLFASPEEATRALVTASQAKDQRGLARIFGPRIKDLLSGDAVSDANDLSDLSAFISEATKLQKESDQKVTLMVGNDEWPFPVSIIKIGDQWRFDTDNGVEEAYEWYIDWMADMTDAIRRIDRNHLVLTGTQYLAELTD